MTTNINYIFGGKKITSIALAAGMTAIPASAERYDPARYGVRLRLSQVRSTIQTTSNGWKSTAKRMLRTQSRSASRKQKSFSTR